MITVGVENKLD